MNDSDKFRRIASVNCLEEFRRLKRFTHQTNSNNILFCITIEDEQGQEKQIFSDDALNWREFLEKEIAEHEARCKALSEKLAKEKPAYQIHPYYETELNAFHSYIEEEHELMSAEQKEYLLSTVNEIAELLKKR